MGIDGRWNPLGMVIVPLRQQFPIKVAVKQYGRTTNATRPFIAQTQERSAFDPMNPVCVCIRVNQLLEEA